MESPTPTIISYSRVSTLKQVGKNKTGLAQQTEQAMLDKLSHKYGLPIDSRAFSDKGKSAFKGNHLEASFGRLLTLIDNGEVAKDSIIAISNLDRLSRLEVNRSMELMLSIINRGVRVYTSVDDKLYESGSANLSVDLILSILIFQRSHEESATKSKRLVGANKKRVMDFLDGKRSKDGYPFILPFGAIPFWMKIVDTDEGKVVMPDDKYVECAKTIVKMFQDGNGAPTITDYLRKHYPEKVFSDVGQLTRNDALAGVRECTVEGKKYRLEDYYYPIMTMDELHQLRALRKKRKAKPVNSQKITLLGGQGLLRCNRCGELLFASTHTRKDGRKAKVRSLYFCGGRKVKRNGCELPTTESLMIDWSILGLGNHNLWSMFPNLKESHLKEIDALQHEVDALEKDLEKATELFFSGNMPQAVATKLSQMEEAKAEKQSKLNTLLETPIEDNAVSADDQSKWNALVDTVIDDADMVMEAERLELRKLIKPVIKSIAVDRDEDGKLLLNVSTANGKKFKIYTTKGKEFKYDSIIIPL